MDIVYIGEYPIKHIDKLGHSLDGIVVLLQFGLGEEFI